MIKNLRRFALLHYLSIIAVIAACCLIGFLSIGSSHSTSADSLPQKAIVRLKQQGLSSSLAELVKLQASEPQDNALFGQSVSISGDRAIVGVPDEDTGEKNTGAVYIFERNQGGADNWGEVKRIPNPAGELSFKFGNAVAISGDTAIVGAYDESTISRDAGAAYIFERNQGGPNNWGEVKKITPTDLKDFDNFGFSVSISGNTVIVGANSEDEGGSEAGAAYIFERDQGGADNWGEVRKLLASDKEERDRFGHSVSISDDTAIVGANSEDAGGDNAGAAYVFARNQGGADNWGEVKKLLASDHEAFDAFGESVSISGDTAIVGSLFEDAGGGEAGAAYIFERDQGGADNWGEVRKLLASDSQANDEFGWSVSISGDAVVVGAHLEDEGGSEAGAAYLFARDQGGPNNWGEVEKLLASDIEVGDLFGNSVAISGDTAIVGSPFNDEGETNAGAAYIFTVGDGSEGNEPPTISTQPVSVARGDTIIGATVATVSDDQTPAGNLSVVVVTAPAGITITNITNTNGTITANVSASCAAALGANTVVLSVTDTEEASAMADLIVTVLAETTPPVITCPANLTVVAPSPNSACVVVNYTTPTATDNCGASVACVPPSGSCLPLGTTTITCTATDTSGNTASCSFTVSTFNLCLQDDSNPNTSMLISTATGAYRFCCGGTIFTGIGTLTVKGSTYTLTHNTIDRRVQAKVDTATNKATASLQAPAGTIRCTITDRDTRNNSCSCTGGL